MHHMSAQQKTPETTQSNDRWLTTNLTLAVSFGDRTCLLEASVNSVISDLIGVFSQPNINTAGRNHKNERHF